MSNTHTAQADITLLQNFTLMRQNGALANEVQRLSAKLQSLGHRTEVSRADWPIQYARMDDQLFSWRTSGVSGKGVDKVDVVVENVAQAQAAWSRFAECNPQYPYLQTLSPHLGRSGPLRVAVLLGGGGLGDLLMFSPLWKALFDALGGCEIVILHDSKSVEAVFKGNPYVSCAASSDWPTVNRLFKAARWAGLFDFALDIFCFAPRLMVCHQSRLDLDRHGPWIASHLALSDTIDQMSSNLGVSVMGRATGLHVLDLVGGLMSLPLAADSPLQFCPDPTAGDAHYRFGLPNLYCTVRDGGNAGDRKFVQSLGQSRTTKQLSTDKWAELVGILREAGVGIVQVGDQNDVPIPGVDNDLRNQTSLSELCFVMKRAVAHVDTEGGLVHFARASNCPSVVLFGPTRASFFAYPSNANLSSDECEPCWYANETWIAQCPRDTEGPLCTSSIARERIKTAVARLKADRLWHVGEATSPELTFSDIATWTLGPATKVELARNICGAAKMDVGVMTQVGKSAHDIARLERVPNGSAPPEAPILGSVYNFPCNDNRFDKIVCFGLSAVQAPTLGLRELARMIKPGGSIVVAESAEDVEAFAALCASLEVTLPPVEAIAPVSDNQVWRTVELTRPKRAE